MSFKFCTIGCGSHAGKAHGPAQRDVAANLPEVELAACCDLDEAKARDYAQRYGFARHYTDVGKMIEGEKPDAVSVVLPVTVACRVASPLLKKGIPLLLEKPPGNDLADFQRLHADAAQGRGPHLVAFNRRFMPLIAMGRRVLQTDMAGSAPWQINYDLIRYDRRDQDFSTTAIHTFDAALFLAGSPLREASFAFVEFPELGKTVCGATVDAGCVSGTHIRWNFQPVAGRFSEEISIHGIGSTLLLDLPLRCDGHPGLLSHWRHDREVVRETFAPPHQDGFYHEFHEFISSLLAGAPLPGPRIEQCGQAMQLMTAFRSRAAKVEFP